jgi:hypothetical protein
MRRLWGTLGVVAVLATGCEPLAPETQRDAAAPAMFSKVQEEAELTFARYARGVGPGVAEAVLTAIVGQRSTLVVRYAGLPVLEQPVLLEFEVGPESLRTDGDGNPVVPGQTVEISVILDPQRFIFYLAPSGVTFSKSDPARLRLNYEGADADVNGDGVVNQRDRVLEQRFRLWQQELQGGPWQKLPTNKREGDVVEGRVIHFTGFALAS